MFFTAKIAFIFTSLSAVQIYDFHLFTVVYSSLRGFICNQHNNQLSVVSSVGRALHWHRKGHGFKSMGSYSHPWNSGSRTLLISVVHNNNLNFPLKRLLVRKKCFLSKHCCVRKHCASAVRLNFDTIQNMVHCNILDTILSWLYFWLVTVPIQS